MKELIQHHHLLFTLAWRDIRIRYKQTVMGFLWAIFMPLLIVVAGLFIKKMFSLASGRPIETAEVASITVKALPWAFFVASIRFATNSLVSNSDLVTKIYFPREVFPLASVLANLVDFTVAMVVSVPVLVLLGVKASVYLAWLPVLLGFLIILTAGLGIFLSCANLFFRDVKYIVEVLLTFGIFFTPVFYEASMFGDWAPLILLNPVGSILEAINDVVVLQRAPDWTWVTYSGSWAVLAFFVAWKIFHKAEPIFAQNI